MKQNKLKPSRQGKMITATGATMRLAGSKYEMVFTIAGTDQEVAFPHAIVKERCVHARDNNYAYIYLHGDDYTLKVPLFIFAQDPTDSRIAGSSTPEGQPRKDAGTRDRRRNVYGPETYVEHAHILTSRLLDLQDRSARLDAIIRYCRASDADICAQILAIAGA